MTQNDDPMRCEPIYIQCDRVVSIAILFVKPIAIQEYLSRNTHVSIHIPGLLVYSLREHRLIVFHCVVPNADPDRL
jgi:hypothetical protein